MNGHRNLSQRARRRIGVVVTIAATLVASVGLAAPANAGNHYFMDFGNTAVKQADCGPGSSPETGLSGDVPAADRDSGRSERGYNCNMTLLGKVQGAGGGIVSANYDHCSYTGSMISTAITKKNTGVQVVDVKDPRNPRIVGKLTAPGMLGGTWENLKVNKKRKLLAGTAVPLLWGGGFFAVYDISDCAHPKLLNTGPGTTTPLPFTSHEGGFSPDGKTYWASGLFPGHLSAIDISDPRRPKVIWQGLHSFVGHGFGISPDGNRMYLSNMAGITVLDTSAVQRRDPYPQVPHIAAYHWPDGQINQHTIPVFYDGHAYAITIDEAGSGGVKIFDVEQVNKPKLAAQIKLEINLPANLDANLRSSMGGSIFSYNAHYCSADRIENPTALACGWESSGIRVFDIADLKKITEIGYLNPPTYRSTNPFGLPNSPHALGSIIGVPAIEFMSLGMQTINGKVRLHEAIGPRTGMIALGDRSTDWCMSPPEFRGNQIWATCSDTGFLAMELSKRVYTPPANQDTTLGNSAP